MRIVIALSVLLSSLLPCSTAAQTRPRPNLADEGTLVVRTDARQITVASALVLAGYDGGAADASAVLLRDQVRTSLAGVDADLKSRLTSFYASHRRKTPDGKTVDEVSDAQRYRALAMYMNPPPSFSIVASEVRIPEDVRDLIDFADLAGELYRTPQFRALLPTLTDAYSQATAVVGKQIAPTVNDIVEYLRTQPIDRIEVAAIRDQVGKIVRPGMTRIRQLVVFVDPLVGGQVVAVRGDLLDAASDLGQQRVGDRYAVFAGPLLAADEAALRVGVLRFTVAPIVEKYRGEIEDASDQLDILLARSPKAKLLYDQARLTLVTDSLVSALNARYQLRKNRLSENGAVASVGDAYDRGEILAPHFYDRLKRFDEVGLDIAVFFPEFIRSLQVDKERRRDEEIAAARAAAGSEPRPAPAAGETVANEILAADRLITEKKFGEARPILERLLQQDQGNARALFGLAQVVENSPDPIESNASSTDDDRIAAQSERLEAAVNLYRKAALNASSRELWLASWSHVYAGRILDFLDLRDEAVVEYQAAVKVGDVPQGAFKEAKAGVATPYEPR